ncbi:MAG: PAS domain S-box protein [Deltaproteobacteria bacterium]|nr:PAS domain S-box protein [Deltaproteobacteria bacterium]
MEPRPEKQDVSPPPSDWYRQLLHGGPDSLLVVRLRDGCILDLNDRFEATMGYSRRELIGRSTLDLDFWVYPEDREALKTLLRENQGFCSGFETTMRNKAGQEYPVMMSARVVEIDGDQVVISQSREDSERRRIREALRESEKKFREMVEFLPVIIYETDQVGRLTFANQGAFSFFGYTPEDFQEGLNVLDMISSKDRVRAENDFRKALQEEKIEESEYEILKKDGTRFQGLIASAPIIRDNRPVGLRGVITDITGLRQSEKKLQESRELYQTVVEMSNDAITIVQGDLHHYVNPKLIEIFGYENAEEIVGHSILQMIHPDDRDRVLEINRQRQKGEPVPDKYIFKGIRKDGRSIYLEISAKRLHYRGKSVSLVFMRDITDRIEAEAALRESEERTRLIFDTVPDSITITRVEDGRYLEVNNYFYQLTGFSREETIGRTVTDLNVFVNHQDRQRFIREMQEKGEVSNFEILYRKKDGSLFTTLLSARPIRYAGEDCLVAVVTDITSRKRIEDALRQSEQQHRKLVEAMREGFGVVNEHNEVTYINKRFCELMGYRPEEMVGGLITDFVNPENRKILQEQGERRRKGEKGPYEVAWTRKDGQLLHTLMSPEPVFDEQGQFRGSFAVITDISERKQMEEALKKSEERYRLLVENANEGILVLQDGLIRFANPRAAAIINRSLEDLIGRPFIDFVDPDDREMTLGYYRHRMSNETAPHFYALRLIGFGGTTVWVESTVVVINWEGQPAVLVFTTDITEKKKLELQFLQAQKMEAIGRLAGGVAHDFNNLLTSIIGHADLMLLELRRDDPLVGDIQEIKKAADRATDLTRQLLAFSRKQVLQPKILNLNQVIEDMKKMLRRMIGEDIELKTDLAPDLGRVLVDPGQIDQVIMNLIVNARDAMPRGGKLTIGTANAEITDADVRRYLGSKSGAYVLLEVSDNGLGMSEEIQSHIFEPFFTTKELGKGTGLGLSTVYGIVKQSTGYIWVDSEPGQGTSFKIYLPRIEGEAVAEIRPGKTTPSYRGTETILLVEDNDLVRQLARSVLAHYGYNLLEARNGEEAYRLGKGYEGPIQLLLTDVVMPGISGQTLAEQIKALRPEIEVLFMSGYSEEATLRPGYPGRGDRFLQKPFSPSELAKRIRELLDNRREAMRLRGFALE